MKTSIRNLYFAVFWAILFIVLYRLHKIPANLFENALFNLGFEALLIAGPLIYAFFSILYISFTQIPAKMFDEYGGFVEKPYILSSEPHPDAVGITPYARAINVKTTTPFDVTERRLELLEAKNANSGKDILRRREYLLWSGREGMDQREPKTIQGKGQSRLCNVAQWLPQPKIAIFVLGEGPYITIPDGEYELTVRVTGKWQGHNFNYTDRFFLGYHHPTIQLGNNLDELDKMEIIEPKEERKELQLEGHNQAPKPQIKNKKKKSSPKKTSSSPAT